MPVTNPVRIPSPVLDPVCHPFRDGFRYDFPKIQTDRGFGKVSAQSCLNHSVRITVRMLSSVCLRLEDPLLDTHFSFVCCWVSRPQEAPLPDFAGKDSCENQLAWEEHEHAWEFVLHRVRWCDWSTLVRNLERMMPD